MKILLLALVFTSVLLSGSSLKCVRCFPPDEDACLPSPETCIGKNTCISYEMKATPSLKSPPIKHCASMEFCLKVKQERFYKVKCCQTDFCNLESPYP